MRIGSRRWLGALAAGALGVAGLATPARADDRYDLVRQQEQEEAEIENLRSSLGGVDVDLQNVYLKLQETQAQVPGAQAAVLQAQNDAAAAQREQEKIGARLDAAKGELDSITTSIAQGEKKLSETRDNLGEIARSEYRGDNRVSTVELLIGAKSSADFFNALSANQAITRVQSQTLTDVTQTTAANRTRAQRQKAVQGEISQLKSQADAAVAEKKSKEAAAAARTKELADLEASVTQQSQALEARRGEFQNSLSAMNAARDDTAAQIARIDEENRRRAAEAAAQGGGGGAPAAPPAASGALIPPVPAPLYVTSPFGMRVYPFDGGWWMHEGVDLRSACGNPQYAAAAGVVAAVRPASGNGTHGNQVILNLGYINGSSYVVVYNHLSGFNVSVGQSVGQGDVIGWTGMTGMVTGCHVHFEVWQDGVVIDPMSLPGFYE